MIGEQDIADFPSVVRYRFNHIGIQDAYAAALESMDDVRGAVPQRARLATVRDKTATDFPDILLQTRYAADCHRDTAELAFALGDYVKGMKHVDLANSLYSKLSGAAAENGNVRLCRKP
jgi:hypothetical protein